MLGRDQTYYTMMQFLQRRDQNMIDNTTPNPLLTLAPTPFRTARNWLLSTVVPVNFALNIARRVSPPTAEQGVFKSFIEELSNGLIIKVGSSDFIAHLIPRYINETLSRQMGTGELLEFSEQLEFDLTQAYASDCDEKTRHLYKERAFQRIMMKLGPHGLKFIQTMRPKDANSWIAKVIATAQSDLPVPSINDFEAMLKNAFKEQGSLDYVEHFSEACKVVKFYGAGTIGITALVEFRSLTSPEETPKLRVVKIVRPGSLQNFLNDHACFANAAQSLLAEKIITEKEAQSFNDFNSMMATNELKELNLNLETANLANDPYNAQGVCETVKCDLELTGRAHNLVIMDLAPGIPLGKYLQSLSSSLVNSETDNDKRPILAKIAHVRSRYAQLALFHYGRASRNQSIHTDLHPGNLFYDEALDKMMVLDLGSMAQPLEPAEHLKLNRFLLAVNLTLGTADSHFLRLFYQKELQVNHKLTQAQIEPMLVKIQTNLDQLRNQSASKSVIDVDAAADKVMSVIKDTILAEGIHIVPAAMFPMAKANAPVSDALEAMRYVLTSSSYGNAIPYRERTQFALAMRASYQARNVRKDVWTQETWEYFYKSILHPKAGLAQLQFQKKFIYGIFGMDDDEAASTDVLIPTALIAAPIAVYLGAIMLKKMVNTLAVKIPEIVDSYQLIQKLQAMYRAGKMSRDDSFHHMTDFFKRTKQHYGNMYSWSAPEHPGASKGATMSTEVACPTANPRSSFFSSCKHNPFFKRFLPGVIVGAIAVEGIHLWTANNTPKK